MFSLNMFRFFRMTSNRILHFRRRIRIRITMEYTYGWHKNNNNNKMHGIWKIKQNLNISLLQFICLRLFLHIIFFRCCCTRNGPKKKIHLEFRNQNIKFFQQNRMSKLKLSASSNQMNCNFDKLSLIAIGSTKYWLEWCLLWAENRTKKYTGVELSPGKCSTTIYGRCLAIFQPQNFFPHFFFSPFRGSFVHLNCDSRLSADGTTL